MAEQRESQVPLESVLLTAELYKRPSRPPDYEAENNALVLLCEAMAESPRTILQTLSETMLEVLQADSAGVSLLSDDGQSFYWPAIAGIWKPHIGGGTPRDFGPCGDVLDRNAPLAFRQFERRYTYFQPVTPAVEECLLVPFYAQANAVGTIWVIAHNNLRKFDCEDLRQLLTLGRFASLAYWTIESLRQQWLVHELSETNAALKTARDQALEASNLKSAFVANISHELRTPVSGIIGMNELLLARDQDSENRTMLEMMYDSANALLTVVNDILDLSKIEAGKVTLEYEPFNLISLVQDCTKLLAPAASAKQLGLEVLLDERLPQSVYGDAFRVRQVLLNLIGNAIKFTPAGKVTVRADVERQDAMTANVGFKVVDTGIGIRTGEERFLFMPFAQADNSSTRRYGGTGLGLTISKRFVEMMHGEIGFESEEGQGSTFWFDVQFDKVPLDAANCDSAAKVTNLVVEPVPSVLAHGKKVLIVEDNVVLQSLAVRQIELLGLQASAVGTGGKAIEQGASGQFDVILMDVNLPDINGNEATRAIRAIEQSAGKPPVTIIAMTSGVMAGDREMAIAAGMDDYLAKPVSVDELKFALEEWLTKKL